MVARHVVLALDAVDAHGWRAVGNQGNTMTLLLTFTTLAVTFLLLPNVFAGLWYRAVEQPAIGIGLLALLALVGVWV